MGCRSLLVAKLYKTSALMSQKTCGKRQPNVGYA